VHIIARGIHNLLTNFNVSGTFHSRLTGQHLSDARDLATLTLEVTVLVVDADLRSVCVANLKFVGLPVHQILGIYCVSINRPGDLYL